MLRRMKELVFASKDKDDFIQRAQKSFPDYEGAKYLEILHVFVSLLILFCAS